MYVSQARPSSKPRTGPRHSGAAGSAGKTGGLSSGYKLGGVALSTGGGTSGVRGVAKSRVSAEGGMVFVAGARWQAVSKAVLEEGSEVIVEEVLSHPTRLCVRAIEKGDPSWKGDRS